MQKYRQIALLTLKYFNLTTWEKYIGGKNKFLRLRFCTYWYIRGMCRLSKSLHMQYFTNLAALFRTQNIVSYYVKL